MARAALLAASAIALSGAAWAHHGFGANRVEVEVGVRVHEVDTRERALERDVLVPIHSAEAVMRPTRRRTARSRWRRAMQP